MSLTPNDHDELNDSDFTALFDAAIGSSKTSKPSAELDALILQNAHNAQLESVTSFPTETFSQKYRPVIATAAVLLICVALTPLNTRAPVSEADNITASSAGAGAGAGASASASTSASASATLADAALNPLTTRGSEVSETQADTDALGIQAKAIAPEIPTTLGSNDSEVASSFNSNADTDTDTEANVNADADADATSEAETKVTESVEEKYNVVAQSISAPAAIPAELSIISESSTKQAKEIFVESQADDSDAVGISTNDQPTSPSSVQSKSARVTPKANFPELTIDSDRALDSNRALNKNQSNIAQEKIKEDIESQQTEAVQTRKEKSSNDTDKKVRVKPENYRSSPLLWIIEIKHLYNEKNKVKAREELTEFRKSYPNNSNERLLPDEFRSVTVD